METADILIVGGGPAGSACAWKLRKSGMNVIVLDKAHFPRHKVCAGWITPSIVQQLALDIADYQSQHVIQPITRFLTGLIHGSEIETVYSETVSYGIRRCEFDGYLLTRSDARLVLGESFQSLRRDGSEWIVNDRFRAPFVIGAGGHFCPIARQLQANLSSATATLPVVVAQEVEFEMTDDQQQGCTVAGDRPELFFCPDLKGYGWVFRKGNYLNVGLGREAEDHLSVHVARFVEFLKQRGKVTFTLPGKFQGHAYKLRTKVPRFASEPGVLLIGDSLGLADRQSGEGIRPAIESGLLCADSILEAGTGARDRVNGLYLDRLRRNFENSASISTWVPGMIRELAARYLMSSRWFTRRYLLDRWFLHR